MDRSKGAESSISALRSLTARPAASGSRWGSAAARLRAPNRDSTYDNLPILLGLPPVDGSPEELVLTELQANVVFLVADDSDLSVSMLKAQLLAARLNGVRFPGFRDATFSPGLTVADVVAQANAILDDLAHGIPKTNDQITAVSDLLDAANNGEDCPTTTATPSPSPTGVAGEVRPPSGLPPTGSSGNSGTRAITALALLGAILVAVSLPLLLRSRR